MKSLGIIGRDGADRAKPTQRPAHAIVDGRAEDHRTGCPSRREGAHQAPLDERNVVRAGQRFETYRLLELPDPEAGGRPEVTDSDVHVLEPVIGTCEIILGLEVEVVVELARESEATAAELGPVFLISHCVSDVAVFRDPDRIQLDAPSQEEGDIAV